MELDLPRIARMPLAGWPGLLGSRHASGEGSSAHRQLAKAVLVSGQAYQDPKDAFNEFVSNAADEYAEADRRGERIRIVLRRKGRYPIVAVDDTGGA